MGIFSDSYIDRKTSPSDLASLIELHGAILSLPNFDFSQLAYGLPDIAFVFVETVAWLSQSVRSGSWTYFESTPEARVNALLRMLEVVAPKGLVEQYRFGATHWVEPSQLEVLDRWVANSERDFDAWLCGFVRGNQREFQALIA